MCVSAQKTCGDRRQGAVGFIEPELATSIDKVPSGECWIHEIKFDGYRVQAHLRDATFKRFLSGAAMIGPIASERSRPMLGTLMRDRRSSTAKVVVANGTTDFSVLQNELKDKSTKIVMVAFDLLYLNGHKLRKLPLFERKTLLKKIIAGTDVQFSESFEVDCREMCQHACSIGLQGVVSKVRDSKYVSRRSHDWQKKTCAQRETLLIAGFSIKDNEFDGIYVGRSQSTFSASSARPPPYDGASLATSLYERRPHTVQPMRPTQMV